MSLATIIKNIMNERDLNQTELAKIIDLKPSQISEIINEKYKPGYDTIKNICVKLNISSDYLFELENEDGTYNINNTNSKLTIDEERILQKYRKIKDKYLKELIENYIDNISNIEKRTKGVN